MTLSPVVIYAVQNGQLVRWMGDGGDGPPPPAATVPGVPTAVGGAAPTATSGTLTWSPPASDGGSPVTGYLLSRPGMTPVPLPATARSYTFGGLTASTVYSLSVEAVNAVGTGPATTKTVTTQAAVVTGARFPGDPNPLVNGGGLYFGESVLNNGSPAPQEAGTGTIIGARHLFWDITKVPSAMNVPNGAMAQAAVAAHTAGHLPVLSIHYPGSNWAGNANGAIDGIIDAWIAWCEAQAKPIFWIVNHEPENGDGVAADFRAWMQHIRSRMTVYENAHGPLRRLTFCGCLMSYTFQPGNGGPAAWWPGDGVWDVLGIDHYVDTNSVPASGPGTTLLGPLWTKTVSFATAHNTPIFVTEWGVRPDNPLGAQIMQEFYDYCTSGNVDVIGQTYFNNGSRWALTDNNGMLSKFRALLTAPKSIHMSDLGF